MVAQIEAHYRQNFTDAIRLAAQQMMSKLEPTLQFETIWGEKMFFDTYGAVSFTERTSRNAPNNYQEAPRDRRAIDPKFFEYSELFDPRDRVRLMRALEPNGQFMRMVMGALGRKKDSTILTALNGTAQSGKNGNTAVSFDTTNQVVSIDGGTGVSGAGPDDDSGLTIEKIRLAREILESADVDLEGEQPVLVVHPTQKNQLMADTNVTSSDFVGVRPIETAQFGEIQGARIITTTQLSSVTHSAIGGSGGAGHYAWMYVPSTGVFGMNREIEVNLDTIPHKGHAKQLAVYTDMAATRLFENKIVRIDCVD